MSNTIYRWSSCELRGPVAATAHIKMAQSMSREFPDTIKNVALSLIDEGGDLWDEQEEGIYLEPNREPAHVLTTLISIYDS